MPAPVTTARRRPGRLENLNNPPAESYKANKKAPRSSPPSQGPPKPPPVPTCCDTPEISMDPDGSTMCYSCGALLRQSQIVSEVTFGENAAGGAVVQGGFVGENQRHANTMGGTMRGLGGMGSREQTEWHGRDEIRKLCGSLHLRQTIEEQAFRWYKLALNHSFVQGRRIRNVAAVAIYFAARKSPENTLLLMDLAEKIHINIWVLGDTYKGFIKRLMEKDPGELKNTTAIQEIEPLMLKYCRKLEFDHASHKVANDACAILKRMKRDWMVQGRQPAGLCGACIILAARMNNFRRTIREVVYVVKVADTTINKRLYEYTRTESAKLTVEQFREFGHRLKVKTQPPAIWRKEEAEERKRKRAIGYEEEDTAAVEEPAEAESSSAPSQKRRSTRKKQKTDKGKAKVVEAEQESPEATEPRRDADGFVIPDLPVDQVLMDVDNDDHMEYLAEGVEDDDGLAPLPKKFYRKSRKEKPIIIPQEDLDIEEEIEYEIEETIKDWESVFGKFKKNPDHPVLRAAERAAAAHVEAYMPNANISNEIDLGEDEFAGDPEVEFCELTPEEVAIKERIWITENEDWLRAQQAKILAKALEEASGKVKKPKQRRKHNQMGDGSVLEGQPAASAAEAAHKMFKKRQKNFSAHINYDRLREIYPEGSPTTEASTPEGSGAAASPAASASSRQQARAPPVIEPHDEDEDAEGEDDDEVPVQYQSDSDIEHEHDYDHDDGGFGDTDYPEDF